MNMSIYTIQKKSNPKFELSKKNEQCVKAERLGFTYPAHVHRPRWGAMLLAKVLSKDVPIVTAWSVPMLCSLWSLPRPSTPLLFLLLIHISRSWGNRVKWHSWDCLFLWLNRDFIQGRRLLVTLCTHPVIYDVVAIKPSSKNNKGKKADVATAAMRSRV